MTPQRRVVAEVLRGEHVHLSAEAIHAKARRRLPEISLATVYNTLNELVLMGEVLEVSAGHGPRRYDPNAHEPHQHLVCLGCDEILDVRPAGQAQLGLPRSESHGYDVTEVDIVFRGRCPRCQRGRS